MDKIKFDPEIHKRKSIRLKGYNYLESGIYFVTICTYNREHMFGEIINGEMKLNEIGKIAEEKWFDLVNHNINIRLLEFIVMPNHIHGLIEIDNNVGEGSKPAQKNQLGNKEDMESDECVNLKNNNGVINNGMVTELVNTKRQSLTEIIRQYKTFSAKQINIILNAKGTPVWQRNYFEKIIRNEQIYYKVSEYIKTNPLKWQDDKYFEVKDK